VGTEIDHPRLDYLAAQIKSGAMAFLREEYKYLSIFVFGLGIALLVLFTLSNSRVRLPLSLPSHPLTLHGIRVHSSRARVPLTPDRESARACQAKQHEV